MAGRDDGPGDVIDFMAESFRRLEDSVARGFESMQQQFSKLPGDYVARREFDRYRDEQVIQVAAIEKRHDDAIDEIKETLKDSRATRHQWLALAITALIATPASIYAIVQIFANH